MLSTLLIIAAAPAAPLAYIDPSTGGLVFQLLAAFLAMASGALFFFSRQIKSAWARLRRKLRKEE